MKLTVLPKNRPKRSDDPLIAGPTPNQLNHLVSIMETMHTSSAYRPVLIANWSKMLLLTARYLSPLPGFDPSRGM